MTAAYRFRQGIRALLAFSQPVDYALAAAYLTPQQRAVFRRMRHSEQLHSLNVLRTVLAQSSTTPAALSVAALLHDVGKICYPLGTAQKTLVVLTRAALPGLLRRWSAGSPAKFWQRPFVVYAQHPAWSAELLAEAGASNTAIWLVAHHQDPLAQWVSHPNAPLLARLQAADDKN